MFSALTFNMQNGQVWDDADPDNSLVNLDQAIAFIREQDADVVFLQEVEPGFEGGRQIEPPPNFGKLRAALPAYDAVFGYPIPNPLEIPFGLGLAIFSKTPLGNFFRVDLPPALLDFEFAGVRRKPSHRLLIGAETAIEGHPLRLLNTHLQAFFMVQSSSDDQPQQRDLVEKELRESRGPTLLGGDFNTVPGEKLVEQLESTGFRASQKTEVTWRRKPLVLDYIFHNASLRLESCRVIPTMASDHHAVRCEYSFVP